jgi:hypothetical protein
MGGVLLANGFYADCFRHAMLASQPNAYFLPPRHTPAEGAILLALRSLDAYRSVRV